MDLLLVITIVFYLASTAAYVVYLYSQKTPQYRAAFLLLGTGFVFHCLQILLTAVRAGRFPAQNLHETLVLAAWAVVGVFMVFQYRYALKILGVYTAPLAALITAAAVPLPREPAVAEAILNNAWLVVHIFSVFVGEASLALACGLGCLYLLQERAIKTKNHGFFFKRLPPLELLDSAGYVCIVTGFALITLGLITGFVYAKALWGRFWSWDPKEIWSGITWLIYAALLHQRLTVGWRGRRAALMAILGFVVVLFTFLGVNLLLEGHHGDFTPWK